MPMCGIGRPSACQCFCLALRCQVRQTGMLLLQTPMSILNALAQQRVDRDIVAWLQAVSKFVSNLYDGHALDRYVRATSFAFSALSVQTIGSPRCVPTILQTKGCGAKSVCVFCAGFIAQIRSPKSWIGCWRNVGSGRTSLSECRHEVPHKFPQIDNVRD